MKVLLIDTFIRLDGDAVDARLPACAMFVPFCTKYSRAYFWSLMPVRGAYAPLNLYFPGRLTLKRSLVKSHKFPWLMGALFQFGVVCVAAVLVVRLVVISSILPMQGILPSCRTTQLVASVARNVTCSPVMNSRLHSVAVLPPLMVMFVSPFRMSSYASFPLMIFISIIL